MAQETLNSLIAVMKTLSFQEQEQVIIELQDNIIRYAPKYEPTDEQKARLREAYRQAQAGEVYSQEEAHRMMDEFVEQRLHDQRKSAWKSSGLPKLLPGGKK